MITGRAFEYLVLTDGGRTRAGGVSTATVSAPAAFFVPQADGRNRAQRRAAQRGRR